MCFLISNDPNFHETCVVGEFIFSFATVSTRWRTMVGQQANGRATMQCTASLYYQGQVLKEGSGISGSCSSYFHKSLLAARLQSNTMPSVPTYSSSSIGSTTTTLLQTIWQALKTSCSCVWKPWEDVVCSRYQFSKVEVCYLFAKIYIVWIAKLLGFIYSDTRFITDQKTEFQPQVNHLE